jgi:glycosyltransferase involved in cell wall biosynthesis
MSDLDGYEIDDLRAVWPESQYDNWIADTGKTGLVSVIIPTYNRANLIRETLDSVYEQHYRPIEIIVVDDGSEDNTETVVKSWSEGLSADGNLTVTYHRQENQGVASARNTGIKKSKGDKIQLLDSDDKLHPNKICTQVEALRSHPPAKYIYCLTTRFGGEGDQSEGMGYDITEHGLQRALVEHPYQTSAALYERGLLCTTGPFGKKLHTAEDWEFAIRAYIASGGALVYQDVAYNHQRDSSHERLSGQGRKFHEGRLRAMCHNKKVLEHTGLLKDPNISSSLSLNFVRIAFLLHSLESSKVLVRKALQHACDTSSGVRGFIPKILRMLQGSETAFRLASGLSKFAASTRSYLLSN